MSLDDLLDRLGELIPCSICGHPTPPAELTETYAPGALAFDGSVVVERLMWVCLACPLP